MKARWEKTQAGWTRAGSARRVPFALAGGDARRGAQQFFDNAMLPCARCHKVGGDGGEAGPI